MNRLKLAPLVLLLVMLLAGTGFAAGNKQGKGNQNGQQGHHPQQQQTCMGHHDHFGMMIQRLHLTPQQQASLADILKSNEQAIKDDVLGLIEAKKTLVNTMMDPQSTETMVTDAYAAVSGYKQKLIVLRWQIVTDLRNNVLTDAQKQQLDQMKNDMLKKLDTMQTKGLAALDKWIAEHSQ